MNNNKKKIIISISFILIIVLILLGLTYAYFNTNILGNTNTKSISVDTENLSITYGENDSSIINGTKISPGTTIGNKTFKVKNTGNIDNDYIVVINNINITYSSTSREQIAGAQTSFNSNDFVYTLTCTSSSGTCDGVTEETTLPLVNNSVLINNKIAHGVTHTYTITVKYLETGIDQSNDMNKKLEARVNIGNINDANMNPYRNNTSTLAYKIIDNASKKLNGTELKNAPITKPGKNINNVDEKIISLDNDDYGTSFYYRGNVENNYINFAGMCWRIVRIEGDGSIKLILEDQDTLCENIDYENGDGNWNIPITTGGTPEKTYYGYTQYSKNTLIASDGETTNSSKRWVIDYLNGQTNANKSMATAFKNFQVGTLLTNIASYYNGASIDDYLKADDWCLYDKGYVRSGTSPNYVYTELTGGEILDKIVNNERFFYSSLTRLEQKHKLTFKCTDTIMKKFGDNITDMYVATVTSDEVSYAGSMTKENSVNPFYMVNPTKNSFNTLSSSYYTSGDSYGTVSFYYVNGNGLINDYGVSAAVAYSRPTVVLKSGTIYVSGNGTIDSPYVIN